MPYYFVLKIIFPKNIVKKDFNIMTDMPIQMNVNTSSFRKQFFHQD